MLAAQDDEKVTKRPRKAASNLSILEEESTESVGNESTLEVDESLQICLQALEAFIETVLIQGFTLPGIQTNKSTDSSHVWTMRRSLFDQLLVEDKMLVNVSIIELLDLLWPELIQLQSGNSQDEFTLHLNVLGFNPLPRNKRRRSRNAHITPPMIDNMIQVFKGGIRRAILKFIKEQGTGKDPREYLNYLLHNSDKYVQESCSEGANEEFADKEVSFGTDIDHHMYNDVTKKMLADINSNGWKIKSAIVGQNDAIYGNKECLNLHPELDAALQQKDIDKLYSHQVDAVQSILNGNNTVIATSTASGKSLIYCIPIFNYLLSLCDDPVEKSKCHALVMMPTKALAQDQLQKMRAFVSLMPSLKSWVKICTIDGDMNFEDRHALCRVGATIALVNPDILHYTLLSKGEWSWTTKYARFIVIDECHVYRGLFGSNVAFVLRRTLRHLPDDAQVICLSATIGNAVEHCEKLVGLKFTGVVGKDGAPRMPIVCSALRHEEDPKMSKVHQAADLLLYLIQRDLRVIVFCKTRNECEFILDRIRSLSDTHCNKVEAYRGGYSALERRFIENALFSGTLQAVICTSALEMGIDVGNLDAVIHVGFPGSRASYWQQVGRVGRKQPSSECPCAYSFWLVSTSEEYEESYWQDFHKDLFEESDNGYVASASESIFIFLGIKSVLEQHVIAAAKEMPIGAVPNDEKLFTPEFMNLCALCLTEKNIPGSNTKQYSYHGRNFQRKSIRSDTVESNESYQLIDKSSNRNLEELEKWRAELCMFKGATVFNRGRTFLVQNVDWISRKIMVRDTGHSLPYHTLGLAESTITMKTMEQIHFPLFDAKEAYLCYGSVNFCTQVTRYREVHKNYSAKIESVNEFDLSESNPKFFFPTKALWIKNYGAWRNAALLHYESNYENLNSPSKKDQEGNIRNALLVLTSLCSRFLVRHFIDNVEAFNCSALDTNYMLSCCANIPPDVWILSCDTMRDGTGLMEYLFNEAKTKLEIDNSSKSHFLYEMFTKILNTVQTCPCKDEACFRCMPNAFNHRPTVHSRKSTKNLLISLLYCLLK